MMSAARNTSTADTNAKRGKGRPKTQASTQPRSTSSSAQNQPPGLQPAKRCAIYTRKSTEEGLEQSFNSLDNQREACEAFIRSQQGEGWVLLPDHYDDGGFSGGNMERPALKRLLGDVEGGKVDIVVVHRIDRLTRSLLDFGVIVQTLESAGASFVSVTQQFNTTTSMGRLTLNILLSFAQFERELTTERIREKVAAHKMRGKWCGGKPPLGYTIDYAAKQLVVHPKEAELVRRIFKRYLQVQSPLTIARELNDEGITTKRHVTREGKVTGGKPWTITSFYQILNNPVYIGMVRHKGATYPGEHEGIVSQAVWDEVHTILGKNTRQPLKARANGGVDLLKGLLKCGHCHRALKPSTSHHKNGKLYRYYVCNGAAKHGYDTCALKSVPAAGMEEAVLSQVRALLRTPEVVMATWRELQRQARAVEGDADESLGELDAAGEASPPVREADLLQALSKLDPIWDELFPPERQRLMRLLVDEAVVTKEGMHLTLNIEGLNSLTREVLGQRAGAQDDGACDGYGGNSSHSGSPNGPPPPGQTEAGAA